MSDQRVGEKPEHVELWRVEMSRDEDPPTCSTCNREKTYSAKFGRYVCPGCAWNRFMGRDPRPVDKQEES